MKTRIAELNAVLHECVVNFRSPIYDTRHPDHKESLAAIELLEQELEHLQLQLCKEQI